MEKPIRILQATVNDTGGGLTGYICQNYRRINKAKVQFDFLTYKDKLSFQMELEAMGAKFYQVPSPTHFWAYFRYLKRIKEERGYDAIHFNISYANFVPLLAAKLADYPRIIVHSHSTGIDTPSPLKRIIKMGIHSLGKRFIPFLATDYCACSILAARWMFPDSILRKKKYEVLYNAIDLSRFRFDSERRSAIRDSLGIGADAFVVGHVGRFTYQKNHEFLIQVFQEIVKQEPKSVLLLIGDGPERKKIESQVKASGLQEQVKFLGRRSDVADLYQGMDAIILPSRFEGLCIVAIEAQMAALQTVCSGGLPDETFVSSGSVKLSLLQSAKAWADEVLKRKGAPRKDNTEVLRRAGYDAEMEIKRVEKLYMGLASTKIGGSINEERQQKH